MADRRPTLTASARAGVRNLRSGRKKACGAVEQKKVTEAREGVPVGARGGRSKQRVFVE